MRPVDSDQKWQIFLDGVAKNSTDENVCPKWGSGALWGSPNSPVGLNVNRIPGCQNASVFGSRVSLQKLCCQC